MGTTVAYIDFLDSREKALLLWVVVVLAFATVKGDGVAASFGGVVRAFLAPKLLLLFGASALYCAGAVLLLRQVGLWHDATLKETIYWFITGGLVLVGRAVSNAKPSDPGFYKNLVRQAVQFTIVVEFLVNLYVFPFLIELTVVPVILLFVLLQVVAAVDPAHAPVKKIIDGALIVIGLVLLTSVFIHAVSDPGDVFARENAEALLVAPVLTFAFLPLLWLWGWISRRELESIRKKYRPRYSP